MADLISAISSVFTAAVGWTGTVASTIAGQPILLLACVGIPMCGNSHGSSSRTTLLSSKIIHQLQNDGNHRREANEREQVEDRGCD